MPRRSKRPLSSTLSNGSNTSNSEDGTPPNKKPRFLSSNDSGIDNFNHTCENAMNISTNTVHNNNYNGYNNNNNNNITNNNNNNNIIINNIYNLNTYSCNATNVIRFRFVYTMDDVMDDDSNSNNKFFSPVYTHQLFQKEQIQGYKNLRINIYISQPHLYTYIEINYDEKKKPETGSNGSNNSNGNNNNSNNNNNNNNKMSLTKNCDDILSVFRSWMKGGFTTDKKFFLQQLNEKFVPVGEKHCTYILPSQLSNIDNFKTETTSKSKSAREDEKKDVIDKAEYVYEIWHGGIGEERVQTYHNRLQFLLLFYIENCSYIDPTDHTWEVIILYEKNTHTQEYKTIGYLTLYAFFSYPSSYRLRISQVLIFPPFQRSGHGFELLQHIHFMVRYQHFVQVNVEDPAQGFQLLRDITDVFNVDLCQVFNDEELILDEDDAATNTSSKTSNLATTSLSSLSLNIRVDASKSARNNSLKKITNNGLLNRNPTNGIHRSRNQLPVSVYNKRILKCSDILRITEEQARIVFEVMLYERLDENDEQSHKNFRMFVKKRLLKYLIDSDELHVITNDDMAIKNKLQEMYNIEEKRYEKILYKKLQLMSIYKCMKPSHTSNNDNNQLNNYKVGRNKKNKGTAVTRGDYHKLCTLWNTTHKYEEIVWMTLQKSEYTKANEKENKSNNENDSNEFEKETEKKQEQIGKNLFEFINNHRNTLSL